ncbi:hypothetical protein EFP68_01260 [Lactobacillus helveticus]|uniref:hypothetical protein n=1 Tax=Lactobacillus helveticus TaxID=1587 RepID=UPI001C1DDE08|nr:hypothetical protein [Lactobacillus helveticus]MBU5980030.1 hypothetical protein [Lactobacillus helveticus]MCT3413373.1 hypothetical protein [Lactobacillus helveticus]
MTEETTQNATSEVAKTDTTFVPDWEKKAEKLEEMVKQGLGKQVGYRSVDGQVVEPILLTTEQQDNTYPIVIDKPVGFIAPAYSWFGEQRGYYETAPAYQGRKIQELTEGLTKVVKDQEQIKKDQETAAKDKQAYDKQKDQTLKLVTMITSQLGTIATKIDSLSKQQAAKPTQSMSPVASTEPTQSMSPVASTEPTQSTSPAANTEPTQSADNKGGEK